MKITFDGKGINWRVINFGASQTKSKTTLNQQVIQFQNEILPGGSRQTILSLAS